MLPFQRYFYSLNSTLYFFDSIYIWLDLLIINFLFMKHFNNIMEEDHNY
jgi:hypothetical protein